MSYFWVSCCVRFSIEQDDKRLPKRLLFAERLEGGQDPGPGQPAQHWQKSLRDDFKAFGALHGSTPSDRRTFGVDRLVWTEAARKGEGAPWYTGVLLGAERFMASWHKSEEEASKLRERPLQALVVMAALASPARAFLQASSSTLRRYTAPSRESTVFPTLAAARRRYSTQPGRSLLPLSATDRAEDAARAAEDASRKAAVMALKLVNRAISAGGSEATKASYDEPDDFGQEDFLRSIMTAASATTRLALESLQRDAAGLAAEGVGGRDSMDGLDWRESVLEPSDVEVAVSPIEEAENDPARPPITFALSRDGTSATQTALQRRDSVAADLGAAADDGASARAGRGGAGSGLDADDEGREEPLSKEPDSARTTRNSPAASHSHLSHLLWRQVAGPGDTVVDCTAGNGHDTLELAKIVALNDGVGKLYVMDIQDRALEATGVRLESELGQMATKRSTLVNGNFRQLPAELRPDSVQLIVYNLGWLPGGDKSITTMLEDTLESVEAAKRLVKSGGMISIMLYQGHPEGKRETEALLEYVTGLSHYRWRVFVHDRVNRPGSPVLLTIYKL